MVMPTSMPILLALVLPAAAAIGPCDAGSPGHGRPWCDASRSIAERVDALVAALPVATFPDQLTDMNFGGSLANVTALGLPKFAFNHEACHGILDCAACGPYNPECGGCACECDKAPTSFPQVVGLAASFNSTLWSLVGTAISNEARANANLKNTNDPLNFWAPNMNILRDPRWGRAQETPGPHALAHALAAAAIALTDSSQRADAAVAYCAFNFPARAGEDPMINGDYAVHFVQGMQQRGVERYLKVYKKLSFPLLLYQKCHRFT